MVTGTHGNLAACLLVFKILFIHFPFLFEKQRERDIDGEISNSYFTPQMSAIAKAELGQTKARSLEPRPVFPHGWQEVLEPSTANS